MRAFYLLLVLLTTGLNACIPVCETKQTRCNGTQAEVCDSNGRWQQVMDCSKVVDPKGASWSCCPVREGDAGIVHTCLPAGEHAGGDR